MGDSFRLPDLITNIRVVYAIFDGPLRLIQPLNSMIFQQAPIEDDPYHAYWFSTLGEHAAPSHAATVDVDRLHTYLVKEGSNLQGDKGGIDAEQQLKYHQSVY
ncbi:hypothetical protein L1887_18232 [Cichorium endivia]|nr:hypothetical protein L1887_18232 [Cichorium endivia]